MRKRVGPAKSTLTAPVCDGFPPAAIAQTVVATQYFRDRLLQGIWTGRPMTDERRPSVKDSRQDRLKDKLRENLKRRKSQERARSQAADAPSNEDKTSPHGELGKPR